MKDFYLYIASAQGSFSHGAFENQVQQIIKRAPQCKGWPNERMADLYALIVEAVTPEDTVAQVETKVKAAWENNARRFHG